MWEAFVRYMTDFNTISVLVRILLAAVLGGVIGSERGRHGRAAGLRTHILVCVGSAMTSLTGLFAVQVLGTGGDAFRIAAQVVSGIGFLGVGMILVRNRTVVTGLTTAAIMWTTAIIGISIGIGFYSGAFLAMLACLFTATILTRIERKRRMAAHIYIEVEDLHSLGSITEKAKELLPDDCHLEIISPKSGMVGNLGIYIITSSMKDIASFQKEMETLPGIHFMIVE